MSSVQRRSMIDIRGKSVPFDMNNCLPEVFTKRYFREQNDLSESKALSPAPRLQTMPRVLVQTKIMIKRKQ